MTRASAYLDYNASAPLRPEAAEAMARALGLTGNASSVHRHGRLVRRAMEEARADVARLALASPSDVVFTSGGTEANALAICGAAKAGLALRLLIGATEHPSVLAAAEASGLPVTRIPVDGEGRTDLAALEAALAAEGTPALVSVMAANNETGVVQPVKEIAAIVRAAGALFHTDAVQAAGKLPLDETAEADLVSLSAHKIGGPQGVGALVVRNGTALAALQLGGGQEKRLRGGTENIAGIAGFGAAAAAVTARREQEAANAARLRDAAENSARAIAGSRVRVIGDGGERLANTTCLAVRGAKAETLVIALDLAGASVSAGSACSSGKVTRSHVLDAMGLDGDTATSAIRVSFGWASTDEDVERFAQAFETALARQMKNSGDVGRVAK